MVLCVLFISSSVFCNLGLGNPESNHVTYITLYDACTDPTEFNDDPSAEFDDDSCIPVIIGCMDETASASTVLSWRWKAMRSKAKWSTIKLYLAFTGLQATLAVFPNPVSATSNISYMLLEKGEVLVKLVDIQGRVLEILDQGARSEGLQNIEFNASDLASGTYAIRLTVKGVEVSSERVVKAK